MYNEAPLPLFTLLPPFYDKPLHKNATWYLKRIEGEFSIPIRKYEYLKWPFDNDVFIINDKIVFRFPKTQQARSHLQYEINFTMYLNDKVSIQIPRYDYVSKRSDFAGYFIIPGKNLTYSVFNSLSRKNKEKVVNELVEFINVFHHINTNEFETYKPARREDFIEAEKRIEKELKHRLFPKLSKKEVDIIKSFYKESKEYLQKIQHLTPIHGDLYAWNIIWDKKTAKPGVIDLSDYMLSDPARDFEVFYDYGAEYAEMAYEQYKGKKDKEFLKRAEIYYKTHGIYTLLSSLLGARISFNYAYKYYFKKKFNL